MNNKNILMDGINLLSEALAKSIDKMIFEPLLFEREISHYREVKVPRYFSLKLPMVNKDYDDDYEYGTGEFKGLLISMREVLRFRIGTKVIKQPVYKSYKKSDKPIKFVRYGKLKP